MENAIRVVFDTNVLLSLFVFKDSRFAPLRGEVVCGRWIALSSERCLAEFRRVLDYPMFDLPQTRQEDILAQYAALVCMVDSPPRDDIVLPKCRDRDDQKFLELARDGTADWLISADKLVLKLGRGRRLDGLFRILTPDEALASLTEKVDTDETAAPLPAALISPAAPATTAAPHPTLP